ncbi:MAG TPA: YiiX/YebB-like N1pC/P60 family cysteine hydrolase [Chitinophagaceae bacterium]
MKKYFLFFSLIIVAFACTDHTESARTKETEPLPDSLLKERWELINIAADSIQEGDLVLRCGNDNISESLSDFSQQEKLYSHSGVAIQYDGKMYVYSNMAGDINPDEIMRRDPVDSFITPIRNIAIGIYRYDMTNTELERLKNVIDTFYGNKLQFDMNFDPATDDKMYCAEMIAKSVERATANRIMIPKSQVNDKLRKKYLKMALQKKVVPSVKSADDSREYWAIDNLYLNPHCREVIKVVFAKPQTPIKFPTPEIDKH